MMKKRRKRSQVREAHARQHPIRNLHMSSPSSSSIDAKLAEANTASQIIDRSSTLKAAAITTSSKCTPQATATDRNIVMIWAAGNYLAKRPATAAARNSLIIVQRSQLILKITMFLLTTGAFICSQSVFQANCQKQHRIQQRQQHQPESRGAQLSHEQAILSRTLQAHSQLARLSGQGNRHYQPSSGHSKYSKAPQRATAERRASANLQSPSPTPSQQQQQQQSQGQSQPPSNANGDSNANDDKLLVCYYTTRQSAPYWPKDAREYAIPAEGLGSMADLSQAAAAFAPVLQYEQLANNNGAAISGQQHANPIDSSLNPVNHVKNQQQQLLFKSAAVLVPLSSLSGQQQQPIPLSSANAAAGGQIIGSGGGKPPSSNSAAAATQANNGGARGRQQQFQKETDSQVLANGAAENQQAQQQQVHYSSLLARQASIGSGVPTSATTTSATTTATAGASGNKNKQTPAAYSFIGEPADAGNNGLFVASGGNGGSDTLAPPQQSMLAASASGNNGGNNFIISKASNNGGGGNSHQERNSAAMKSAQQLVFAPSLSRAAFIVGNSGSSTNGNSAFIGNFNNEILDTKSQLFIPSQQTLHGNHHQGGSSNYYYNRQQQQQQHQQAQQTTTTAATSQQPLYQQQHGPFVATHKGKSLQVLAGEQLSPSAQQAAHPFSGPVSSAPPFPLSSASSASLSQEQSVASAATANPPGGGASYRSSNGSGSSSSSGTFQQFSSPAMAASTNQLIVPSGSSRQSLPPSAGLSTQASASANSLLSTTGNLKQHPANSAAVSVGGSSTSTVAASVVGGSAGSPPAAPLLLAGQQPSAGLVSSSSPLSTMFDVFGAASHYLMRFKPSSLISPSSFTFNTISTDQNHHHRGTELDNATLFGSLAGGSGALIPLQFASSGSLNPAAAGTKLAGPSLLVSSHSSGSHSSPPGSSAQSAGSAASDRMVSNSGFLSRFANTNLQSQSNSNQRREDVCGRTIQTPQRRIIGGEGARYGEFPYQVHIKIAKHQCGGALVDRQSIVTAAHCVYHFITRAPVSRLQIVIGAYDIEDEQYQELPPQYFKVNKVKLHPNFRFSASHPDRYDIAILKLDKPVKYTDNVMPVCLPGKDLNFESMVGTVTGFGKTDPSLSNRYGTRLLQKVDVPIIENNECERWHRTRGIDLKIFPEMMCAGYEDGLKDACVGDSGGPLVVKTAVGPNGAFRWTLAGITSAGFGCAQSRQPGIYHRVSHTVDWILENLD